jgi:hypothetical protein
MWKRMDLDETKSYSLDFYQDPDGSRRIELHEDGIENESTGLVMTTCQIPYDLLFSCDLEAISEYLKSNGKKSFGVDAHGIWLTEEEIQALMDDVDETEVPWLNDMPPNFAPR